MESSKAISHQSPSQVTSPAQTRPIVPKNDGHPHIAIKLNAAAQKQAKACPNNEYILNLLDEAIPGTSVGAQVLSLYYPSTPEELEALVARAQKADPTYVPVDMTAW
jgi:hypothetical protein